MEDRPIADLNDCHKNTLASQCALSHPERSLLTDGYPEPVDTVEVEKAKRVALRIKLKVSRKANQRDLNTLHDAVNGLIEEIAAITYADDLYTEYLGHSPAAEAMYQQRCERLQKIREQLAKVNTVLEPADNTT